MLILASQSKTRQIILAAAGVTFTAKASRIDERELAAGWGEISPKVMATRLARAKALNLASDYPETVIIGCDQTAELHCHSLHKAANRLEAREKLKQLAGQTHLLHAALCIVRGQNVLFEICDTARLTMRNFSDAFLDHYCLQADDSLVTAVGCYHIEGIGSQLFEKVEGDHFTIRGLPLFPLLAKLRELGELPT